MRSVQRVSTGNQWEKRYGYSRAVRVGSMMFVTGTVSIGEDGEAFGIDDGYAQTTRIFEIIEGALKELGGSRASIVRSRMYVTDIGRSDEFGRAHSDFFGGAEGHRPALTMVEVSALIDDAFLIEIEVDAVVD